MRNLSLLISFCLLVSCDFINTKKVSPDDIVREEIQSIDWNDVDRYPLFESCDETAPREEQKACFREEFVQHFYKTLSNHQLVVRRNLTDTVKVQLLINNKGDVSIDKSKTTEELLPALDGLMELTVSRLPKVYPALKRDIPVNTRVVMPVVLKVN